MERRADGTGNAAACHTALLASNNLTASRKGVPSLAWPVCVATLNRPCPTMHPSLGLHRHLRECGYMKFYKSVLCVQRTVQRTRRVASHRIASLSLKKKFTRLKISH